MRVIHDITDKEKRGRNQRDNHARDMPAPRAVADQIPASGDKYRADKIKRSIDRGKVRNGRHQLNLQRSTLSVQRSKLNDASSLVTSTRVETSLTISSEAILSRSPVVENVSNH